MEIISKQKVNEFFQYLKYDQENQRCFECDNIAPIWASVNYGIFLCTDCSSKHRQLGVNLSFIRSTILDNWTLEQLWKMKKGGNKRAHDSLKLINNFEIKEKYQSQYAKNYAKTLEDEVKYIMSQPKNAFELFKNVQEFKKKEINVTDVNWEFLETSAVPTSRKIKKSLQEIQETMPYIRNENSEIKEINDNNNEFNQLNSKIPLNHGEKVSNYKNLNQISQEKVSYINCIDEDTAERFGIGMERIKNSSNYQIGEKNETKKVEKKIDSNSLFYDNDIVVKKNSVYNILDKDKASNQQELIRKSGKFNSIGLDYFGKEQRYKNLSSKVDLNGVKVALNKGVKKLKNFLRNSVTNYNEI